MIDGALVFLLVTLGMTLASATATFLPPAPSVAGSTTSPTRHWSARVVVINDQLKVNPELAERHGCRSDLGHRTHL
jgi:hypothetical protein